MLGDMLLEYEPTFSKRIFNKNFKGKLNFIPHFIQIKIRGFNRKIRVLEMFEICRVF